MPPLLHLEKTTSWGWRHNAADPSCMCSGKPWPGPRPLQPPPPTFSQKLYVGSSNHSVLVRVSSCSGNFVIIFDMVAEQAIQVRGTAIWLVMLVRRIIRSKKMITSSSSSSSSSGGRKKTFKFNHHLKEGREVNTFSHDHRLEPRVPHMTAFAGVKPSFMEWSEEVLEFLAVTDYRAFIPLLWVATLSRTSLRKMSCSKGSYPISWKTPNKPTDVVTEITSPRNKPEQKKSTLLKADFFFAMRSSSGDDRRSICHGQKDHEDFFTDGSHLSVVVPLHGLPVQRGVGLISGMLLLLLYRM